MNAAQTRFGSLFMDLLDSLAAAFPECKQTANIRKQLQLNPSDMDTIKLDWARIIEPYNIRAFRLTAQTQTETLQANPVDYFLRIYHEIPRSHIFHQLALCQKYEAFENDVDAKDTLCGYLADLELYARQDDVVGPIPTIEEPTTPLSDMDTNQVTTPINDSKQTQTQSRFDDAELTRLCMEKLGDPNLIMQAQQIVRGIPELSQMYGDRSNEEIANQMQAMQPILPHLMQIVNILPIQNIIRMVQSTVPDPNKRNVSTTKK